MTDIRLDNITKVYASAGSLVRAVDEVSLSIASGEFFFLLGPSGCGKTTLLRIIAGLIEPDTGRVLLGQHDVTELSVEKRKTAMVFQSYALWPHMTVRQNVEFGPKMQGRDRIRRREIAQANLVRVQMEDYGSRKPNQLSGGQQQRVAVARALAAEGECLLLDEPLSNLDARLRLHMRGELRRLVKETGVTAVYVTHDQKEALSMADRVAVMNEGRIVQVGPPEEIYNRPANRFVADFLGEANFVSGKVVGLSDSGLVKVETPVGTLLADPTAAVVQAGRGSAVTCCMRPERVQVLAAGGPTPDREKSNVLAAKVDSSTYLGEMRQYVLKLGSSTHWKALMLAGHLGSLPSGQDVRLAVHSADVSLLME
ncbi:MAG TPA: ABC transporter ATP-binding protein [Phycisphaerae bacterium]|nr:ABC transporter ATP-binding protein [Phycisphaerae bacterium]